MELAWNLCPHCGTPTPGMRRESLSLDEALQSLAPAPLEELDEEEFEFLDSPKDDLELEEEFQSEENLQDEETLQTEEVNNPEEISQVEEGFEDEEV